MVEVKLNWIKMTEICSIEYGWNYAAHNFYYFTDWVCLWIFSLILTGTCEMIADNWLLRSSTMLRSETFIVRTELRWPRCGQLWSSGANLTCCGQKISTKMVSIFFYWRSCDISPTMQQAIAKQWSVSIIFIFSSLKWFSCSRSF